MHFATISGKQVPLQEMKMSVIFSIGLRVNLMYPFPVSLVCSYKSHSLSETQVPLEEMKTSVR